ncbi:putative fatty acyl CoA synthetase 2 [Trypanosoma cruzi]|uniref:Putative fatty acyl CoA synthetase 2 n=1 Tax=Trypanosoma cruzi TaxID=5693 RepID=A0A2V2W0N6_TRYCR|nr:putative fatty acyl CoA synthetase 2 [Trypanosoma cruzi]
MEWRRPTGTRWCLGLFAICLVGRCARCFQLAVPLVLPHKLFSMSFLGLMVQGWGLTETVCVGTKQLCGDIETVVAGQQERICEMCLLDVDEYKHTDTPEPRGRFFCGARSSSRATTCRKNSRERLLTRMAGFTRVMLAASQHMDACVLLAV